MLIPAFGELRTRRMQAHVTPACAARRPSPRVPDGGGGLASSAGCRRERGPGRDHVHARPRRCPLELDGGIRKARRRSENVDHGPMLTVAAKPVKRESTTIRVRRLPHPSPKPRAAQHIPSEEQRPGPDEFRAGHTRRGRQLPAPPVDGWSVGDQAVRVEDELLGGPFVEVLIALRRLVERDDSGVDIARDLHPVVKDRHHQLPVVGHHRALAGGEPVRLRPAETDADRQGANLGGLVDPARPWPRASNPTQSTAASTSGVPRICSICSPRSSCCDRSMVSQPKLRACARRSPFRSPTITTAAPSSQHEVAQARPTGPAPATYTVEPVVTPAEKAPWYPVGKMSESMARSLILARAWSRSGNLSRFQSA